MNFSVLLSLYHKEKPEYLHDCLKSINEQSLKSNEIVIVLDGPIGRALTEVIEKWSTILPIKLLKLVANVGLGQALNQGLAVCSNDVVLRMDTDDICLSDRFKVQVERMEQDAELVLLGGCIAEYDETLSTFLGNRVVPNDFDAIKKQAVIKNPFNHMTVAFRKKAILSVGGYKHHAFMEDYNLWLRVIADKYKVENLDVILVKARTGNSMLMRRKGIEYIKSEIQLFQLKRKLKLQSIVMCSVILVLRTIPRILPSSLLKICYKSQRK